MFRHGQWVSTSTPIPGAHTTPDGRPVGIYQAARKPVVGSLDGKQIGSDDRVPAHVAFVKASGENLTALSEDGNSVVNVRCSPTELKDLQPLIEVDHLPPGRAHRHKPGDKLDP